MKDVRYAARMMAKEPGFAAVAVVSLALGIGANSVIFTLAKAAFLQTVPVDDPSRVVMVYSTQSNRKGPDFQFLGVSYLNARDLREKNDVFSGVGISISDALALTISGKETRVRSQLVSWDFLDILGVLPALGRNFRSDEDNRPGGAPVAILSYALWNKFFGADPGIVGKIVTLNQQSFTVIGIAPREFHDVGALGDADVWVPISMHDQLLTGLDKDWFTDRSARISDVVARLKPGISFESAEQWVKAFAARLRHDYPTDNSGRSAQLVSINSTVIPPEVHGMAVQATSLMMAIVGFVLLIACANVANLLLSRANLRQREIAIRLSLGARRSRLVQQLLTESLMLGVSAGAVAILFAFWGRRLIFAFVPKNLLQNLDFSLDARVLLFTMAVSMLATLLFGLVPALQATRTTHVSMLRDRAAGSVGGSTRWYGLRGILVTAQVAFSLVALVGAGLFIHSLRNAQKIDPGFAVKHELTMSVNLEAQHYPQPKAEQFYKDAVERLRALPTVADASIADSAPLSSGLQRTTFPEGVDTSDPTNGTLTPVIAVQPGYFSAMGISLLRGRDFNDADNATSAMVAIVNRAFADSVWPGEDPLGKHLSFLRETWGVTVVGESSTIKYQTLGEPPQPILYFPLKQHYSPAVMIYLRTKGDPAALAESARSALQSLDPELRVRRVLTGAELLDRSLAAPRTGAQLLASFGLLALILAAIGTYGVMSYAVSQRTHEIGVRMALGARKADVLRLVMRSGMTMVVVGILVGMAASTLLARAIHSLLYGIGLFDASSFAVMALLLITVAAFACSIPAIRASTVDPIVALRYE